MLPDAALYLLLSSLLALAVGFYLLRTQRPSFDRRGSDQPFAAEEQKFATQRNLTYIVVAVFACVVLNVLLGTEDAERSMILQTVINIVMLVLGFWFGSSKQSQDQTQAAIARDLKAPQTIETVKIEAENISTPKEV